MLPKVEIRNEKQIKKEQGPNKEDIEGEKQDEKIEITLLFDQDTTLDVYCNILQ